jgi:UDP-GlcNAc3NAcA epimerase
MSANKKIISVVGARPQFVKAAAVSKALSKIGISEKIIHTGQHYDDSMSKVFFDELNIPKPHWNLCVSGGGHGQMTGSMLGEIENILLLERPDMLVVYGDTNSTLAGALAAAKIGIPIVHVESGLRSFNRSMPEEINRVCADHLSDVLFCSSETGVKNLLREGITNNVYVSGDVMADVFYRAVDIVNSSAELNNEINTIVCEGAFDLLTIHRADTASNASALDEIMTAVAENTEQVIFPAHPRTRNLIVSSSIKVPENIKLISPVSYFIMVGLLLRSTRVITDSGGLQKEAYWASRPCVTLRTESEWTETIDSGWNILANTDADSIRRALITKHVIKDHNTNIYGDGHASDMISATLASFIC